MTYSRIEVQQLTKRFGNLVAVNAVGFVVGCGEQFSVIGPAGAGKTTLLGLLCTLLPPTAGIAHVDGCQLGREDPTIRSRIGALFGSGFLDPMLTVQDNLLMRAAMYGLDSSNRYTEVERAADMTGALSLLANRVGKLSPEEVKRVELARAIVHRPSILFLDSFYTGLDATTRTALRDVVGLLRDHEGMTIVHASDDIGEADRADRLIVMHRGQLLAEGTPEQITNAHSSCRIRIWLRNSDPARERIEELFKKEGFLFRYTEMNRKDVLEVDIANSVGALLLVNRVVHLAESFEITQCSLPDAYSRILKTAEQERETWAH